MSLPKLIFCENHYDPITISIMVKLLPTLKKMGYEVFHPEQPASWTLEDNLEFIEEMEMNKAQILAGGKPKNIRDQNLIDYEIKYAEQRAEYFSLTKSFLNELEKTHIEYKGVDVPRSSEDYRDYLSKEGFNLRDKWMSKAYLQDKRSAFGFIGAFHAQGMQQKILEKQSLEEASNSFLFINIYKEKPSSAEEEALRNGEINHPLSLQLYNANEMTEDQIIASILEQIETKFMMKKNQEQKNICNNLHYSYYTNDKLYGFFNKKEEISEEISWKKIHSPKNCLKNSIKKLFGENGYYKASFLSNLDPQGEKYRQEIMDFIQKPQHFDSIIDKLKILGSKAQKEFEKSDYFSIAKFAYPKSRFNSLVQDLLEKYESKPSLGSGFTFQ